ncbi:MAG: hypothetical protein EXR28_06905 [Betaproteobacteria bacterium]|nr:hypothetical protein [Betaproteobacteria bacterium]
MDTRVWKALRFIWLRAPLSMGRSTCLAAHRFIAQRLDDDLVEARGTGDRCVQAISLLVRRCISLVGV